MKAASRKLKGEQQTTVKVDVKGGTRCYQAPELFNRKASFSRKADVFASGIIFLELLTLHKPGDLYDEWWPMILTYKLPPALLQCLDASLQEDPEHRKYFPDLVSMITGGSESIKALDNFLLRETRVGDVVVDDDSINDSEIYSSKQVVG